ncbi:MAG: helix-turn-helix transcriptional regulator [Bacteroidales bacterium]|nr:helix-turn-helix transcriptional regulator [Bacteroidales bacterium]
MKERIRLFMEAENKSSSQFAMDIGVQPSAVSHVLSGRNKPSLDFIIKMLQSFENLSTDWLLFGKGDMYTEKVVPSLFRDNEFDNESAAEENNSGHDLFSAAEALSDTQEVSEENEEKVFTDVNKQLSERIIIFYPDGTYREYSRRKQQ